MLGPRRAVLVRIVALAIVCGCTPTTGPVAPSEGEPPASSDSDRCHGHGPPHRVKVAEGQTRPLRSGLLVTYETTMYDHYDDGTSDVILHLVFQAASASGEPLPSALTWMPSAVVDDRMHALPTGDCVRIADIAEGKVTLEVAEPAKP